MSGRELSFARGTATEHIVSRVPRNKSVRAALALPSMSDGRGATQLELAQDQGERHEPERHQHQQPEDVHVGEVGRLRLHLLADPV